MSKMEEVSAYAHVRLELLKATLAGCELQISTEAEFRKFVDGCEHYVWQGIWERQNKDAAE